MYILMPYCLTVVIQAYLGYYYPHITCHYDYPIRCGNTDTPSPDRMVLSRPRPPPPPTHPSHPNCLAGFGAIQVFHKTVGMGVCNISWKKALQSCTIQCY